MNIVFSKVGEDKILEKGCDRIDIITKNNRVSINELGIMVFDKEGNEVQKMDIKLND